MTGKESMKMEATETTLIESVLSNDSMLDEIGVTKTRETMGTVRLADRDDEFFVPTPTRDPHDPLNLPRWRKRVVTVLVSSFASVGLSIVAGFGGLIPFYLPEYLPQGHSEADIAALMTYPTLFMGIGNLIAIPLALAIGRRPTFLLFTLLTIFGALLAAYSKTYEWHLAARMVLGIAAGPGEALSPMMIQEIHFIHERGQMLMWQSAVQTIVATILMICASPIAGAVGPNNWYVMSAGLGAVQLLLSVLFVPETRYDRPLSAYGVGSGIPFGVEISGEDSQATDEILRPVKRSEQVEFNLQKFKPRTFWSGVELWDGKADWIQIYYAWKNMFQLFFFPNVAWAFCLNGLAIGVNVAIATTFGNIVTAPPYNWSQNSASYVNAGQIVVSFVGLPLLGYSSDFLISKMAKRNGGFHEPEYRLVPLVIPVAVGILSAVIYGQACQYPESWHWFAIAFGNAGYYFCFVGATVGCITFLLDAYPARSGPLLVIVCALRGFVSFGVSFGVPEFVASAGYAGAFETFAGLTGGLGLLGIPIFFFGKRIRAFTGRWSQPADPTRPTMCN